MGRTSDARDRLLEAASQLIFRKGYGAVGVQELCCEAGVKKGSFYHFFPSKRELALEVLDQYWANVRCGLDRALEGETSPLSRLRAYFAAAHEKTCHHAALNDGQVAGCPLGNLVLEMAHQDEELRQKLDAIFGEWSQRLAALLTEAMDAGEIPRSDPRVAADSLISFIEGAALMAKLRNDPTVLAGLGERALLMLGAPPADAA